MVRWVWFPALLALALFAGCDSGSFVPPRRADLKALPDPTKTERLGRIAMVLAPGDTVDQLTFGLFGRREANRARMSFALTRPKPDDPPSRQAELIREAAASGALAVIVEPSDSPDVAAALEDVRSKGTPVVLIDRPILSRDPSAPFTIVALSPIQPPFQQLAEALRADARSLGLPDTGTALVLVDAGAGPEADRQGRAPALISALTKAGVPKVDALPIARETAKAEEALTARLKADPKVTIVVSPDESGVRLAAVVKEAIRPTRHISIGGCIWPEGKPDEGVFPAAALVNINTPELAREAVRTAMRLINREATPQEKLVPVSFLPWVAYHTTPPPPPILDAFDIGSPPSKEK
jgi:ABC-type sugar transport system substrate-binding protein